ncbi:MAG TPA: VanW family protein [Natronosporangium sp.]|nr:VanW family protein [Natronosporangium sp.]
MSRRQRQILLALVTAVAVVVTSMAGAGWYAYQGEIPRGTVVLGLDIGGMSRQEAEGALTAHLAAHAEALAEPVPIRVGDTELTVDPAEVGLTVDVAQTVARAAEQSVGPFARLYRTREVRPVVTLDAIHLHELLGDVAGEVSEAMTMPEIVFEGLEPVPVYPKPGLGLDPQQSAQAIAAAWPLLGETGLWRQPRVITIPLVEIHPVTTTEEVDRLLVELARPAVAAPVTLQVDGATIDIPPEAIAASLDLSADERGEIVPKVKPKALRKALKDQLAAVERDPVDATVRLTGSGPTVVEGQDGVRVDLATLAPQLLAVLPDPAPRTVEGELITEEPEFTTADAAALGIVEQVSTFTTYFDGGLSLPRNHNIARVAEMVDGALVMPGEVFSLNGYTGERGYAQGFLDAPVILNGRLTPAVGGGISQFTTTLFNAAYYAGLEDVEHTPHSYYYSRYPAVIEATIFYPTLDMKFRNNTEYGVLIDTSYTDSSVTVTLYSTKVWDDVTTEWGPRRNITQPERRYIDPGPDCIATEGIPGFTQDAWRIFWRDGIEVKREKFTWRYDAQPEFICGKRP